LNSKIAQTGNESKLQTFLHFQFHICYRKKTKQK